MSSFMKLKKASLLAVLLVVAGCGDNGNGSGSPILPADPGSEGMTTVAGTDADVDGVRDDIQRYIAQSQPTSRSTRAAMRQYAQHHQRLLLEAQDREKSYLNAAALGYAIDCVFVVRNRLGRTDYAELVNELRAEFLNTEARTAALFQADAQLGGRRFAGDFGNIDSHCESGVLRVPAAPGAPITPGSPQMPETPNEED